MTPEPEITSSQDSAASRWRIWIDLDGTLVGGHPGLRLYLRLPRWLGILVARRRGVIA